MSGRKGLFGTLTSAGILAGLLLAGTARTTSAQVASPLQPGHFSPGVTNIRDLVTAPPGLFVLWYNWFQTSGTYIDRNGNALKSLNLSDINPSLPDVDVDLDVKGFATVPVITWASTFKLLGARYLAGVSPNFVVTDYTFVAEPGGPGFDPVENRVKQDNISGFSDLLVSPVGLSWALGRFTNAPFSDEDAMAAGLTPLRRFNVSLFYSFIAPTGRYETGADDNVGLGFWTHQF